MTPREWTTLIYRPFIAICKDKGHIPCLPLLIGITETITHLYDLPDITTTVPSSPIDQARRKDAIYRREVLLQPENIDAAILIVLTSFQMFMQTVPKLCLSTGEQLLKDIETDAEDEMELPLLDFITHDMVASLIYPYFQDTKHPEIFKPLRKTLSINLEKAGLPKNFRGTPDEMLYTYFKNTPFIALFKETTFPFRVPLKTFSSHGIILAPPNHGKTQLLGNFIADFLKEDVGLIILDPHGDLFTVLERRVDPRRLVVLNPDIEPPALNFLDFGTSTQAETLQTFSYLMSSLSGGLTDKQGAIVPYLLKLLRTIPDASLETLRMVVDEKVKRVDQSIFSAQIAKLPLVDQGFFHNQFYTQPMQITKDAIGWKLYSALSSDAFREMFSAKTNSFDADMCMRERKVVLVKGSRSALGDEGMKVFLQFIVAQFFSAALRRERIDIQQRHLCLLFADEAHHIFNSQTANILTECRKYALGFIAATQVVQQIPDDVKAAIYGATAIKIAGPVSHNDASILAREMYTTTEFIRSMKAVERKEAQFAFHVAGLTDHAVKVTIPYGTLEKEPEFTKFTELSPEPTKPPKPPQTHEAPKKEASRGQDEAQRAPEIIPPHTKVNKEPKKAEVNKPEPDDHTKPDPDY